MNRIFQVNLLFGLVLLLLACNYPNPSGGQSLSATKNLDIETIFPSSTITTNPIPTDSPTAQLTPTPGIIFVPNAAVVFISDGDTLGIQSKPGQGQTVVGNLSPHAENITLSKAYEWLGKNELWVEIQTSDGIHGWVNADYLTEQMSSEAFCMDGRVKELMSHFISTVKERDSSKLVDLISPLHGLEIRHEWWNPGVRIRTTDKIENLFTSTEKYDWGIQDGSGKVITGSFQEIILPLLEDVLNNNSSYCNTLEQGIASGGTTGYIQWPFEYANINYMALYRPAAQGDDLNWRTWAIGIEFIGEKAYIVTLVQYHWEI
jgi:hypothetical protein